jgi:hypothetical protein
VSKGGWSCPKFVDDECAILKRACNPGDKGCILYGKALFSSSDSPSNEAFEKRMERKMKRLLKDKDVDG